MTQCLEITGTGNLRVMNPQPVDQSTCALIVQSWQEAHASPFAMTVQDAHSIGIAIASLWVTVGVLKFFWARHHST